MCTFSTSLLWAALPSKVNITTFEAQTDIEKLTGVRAQVADASVLKTPSAKALVMARESRDQKNYILAIKRYNYIIKNFSGHKEFALALLDKSALYQKMGFEKPAAYNLKRAQMASSGRASPMASEGLKK